jgi:hypothetical protein
MPKHIFKETVKETANKIRKEHARTRKLREAFANKAHEARTKLYSTEAPHLTSELTPEEKAEARAKTTKKANKIWDEF